MKIRLLTFVLFIPMLSHSQENETWKKMTLDYGTLLVPPVYAFFDPNNCFYWKATDEPLKTQLTAVLKSFGNGYLIIDTTNVYNHIVIYSASKRIPIDEGTVKGIGESTASRLADQKYPTGWKADFEGCKLSQLKNYNYVKCVTIVSSEAPSSKKFSASFIISSAERTLNLVFNSTVNNSDDIFKTLEFSIKAFNDGLIDLAKCYGEWDKVRNTPESIINSLDRYRNTELSGVSDFIQEALRLNTKVISDKYLQRPSDKDLKLIYIIRQVSQSKEVDINNVVETLLKKEVPPYELLDNYYSMAFLAYQFKSWPIDLSAFNLQLDSYGLKDDTEKGILFLTSFNPFSMTKPPSGINIPPGVKIPPPNIPRTLKKYPNFSGKPYFLYKDLNFPDFKIQADSPEKSYRANRIFWLISALHSHLKYLEESGDKIQARELVLNSLLSDEAYFKYYDDERVLKEILAKYKK